jgi:hypothetical protein
MSIQRRVEGVKGRALLSGAIGAVGLIATALGAAASPRNALFSYLWAFIYWLTFPMGALFTLTIFHASRARWPIVFRRPLEWMSLALVAFIPLFIPIALGLEKLFVWVSPAASLGEHTLELLAHKRPYLNVGAFLIRTAIYLGLWSTLALLLHRWSREQDASGELVLLQRQQRLSAGALPFLAITFSFAALDWVMSLEPTWGSTIFGVYVFAGSMIAALGTLAITSAFARGAHSFGAFVTSAHFQRLGTLLFAFVCFWAYSAYSQGMLIWIANLPQETTWLINRTHAGWGEVLVALIIGHFAIPFLVLLFRGIKQRGRMLAWVSSGLLLLHALDTYWMVLPALHPDGPHPHWTSLTAWVGIGGIAVAATLWIARGEHALPIKEPFLFNSLEVPLS